MKKYFCDKCEVELTDENTGDAIDCSTKCKNSDTLIIIDISLGTMEHEVVEEDICFPCLEKAVKAGLLKERNRLKDADN